jgi:hypothetical protein
MKQGEAIDVITEAFESSIVHKDRLDALYEYICGAPPHEVISTFVVGMNFARDARSKPTDEQL